MLAVCRCRRRGGAWPRGYFSSLAGVSPDAERAFAGATQAEGFDVLRNGIAELSC
jgi:hypothetical protein